MGIHLGSNVQNSFEAKQNLNPRGIQNQLGTTLTSETYGFIAASRNEGTGGPGGKETVRLQGEQ
jgi:hypothetical protein